MSVFCSRVRAPFRRILEQYARHRLERTCFAGRLSRRHNSQSSKEPKFHPPHPTVMQRLTQIEDGLRYRGYSVLRIGAGLVLLAGGIIYELREHIRDNVADEVSTVATRSMSDGNVQQKAQELSTALLQQILNDPTIRTHAVHFLQDVFSQPETVTAVVNLLTHVLSQQQSKDNLVVIVKHILSESLQDEGFRQTLALYLRYVLENENSQEGLVYLLQNVLNDQRIQDKVRTFCQETLASDAVREEATKLGKATVEQIVLDSTVQQKTGDGLWQAIGYSMTPGWFRGKPQTTPPKQEPTPVEKQSSQDSDKGSPPESKT